MQGDPCLKRLEILRSDSEDKLATKCFDPHRSDALFAFSDVLMSSQDDPSVEPETQEFSSVLRLSDENRVQQCLSHHDYVVDASIAEEQRRQRHRSQVETSCIALHDTDCNHVHSIWKPRLTLSAFRRPEDTIRLTQTDPNRKIEEFYDLHARNCCVLGHGAFSTVRLALRRSDGQKVAVKSIAKHEALRSRRLRRVDVNSTKYYLEEWEILRRLADHPHVIDLLDIFETDDELQLVTEFCPGGELFDAIKQRRKQSKSEITAGVIAGQILRALASLHDIGIVHRDVKPENILLTKPIEDGYIHVKLCDFGVARPLVEHDTSDSAVTCVSSDGEASPLTPGNRSRSFSTVGSDYYAAPELTYGGSYGAAVDIYSLGVTLYIVLCGFPPVFGDTFDELVDDDDFHILFPDAYWSNISDGAKHLLRRMLHPDAAARITAREALENAWIKDCCRRDRQQSMKTQLDLDLVRSQLFKKLGEKKKRRSIPQEAQGRKRHRRRLERRASTSALMALADLYRGVAAPSVVMAAASAAAAEATQSIRTNSSSSVDFVATKPPMTAALSF